MRSLSEHLQLVMSRVRPLEPLALPLLDANGCVLAVDVLAPVDVPASHTSAVIGYAARAREIAFEELKERAQALGANAVVGIDIDYEVVGQNGSMLMVSISGTAVVI